MENSQSGWQKACLDASIIIKLLTYEKDSDQAASFFQRLKQHKIKIIEPSFLRIEVYSVLRKKAYLQELSIQKARKALDLFGASQTEGGYFCFCR